MKDLRRPELAQLTIDDLKPKMQGKAEVYAKGDPFPHIVIDNFFPQPLFEELCGSFPGADAPFWDKYDYQYQTKMACNQVHELPDPLRSTLHLLNSGGFLELLEDVTGEKGLISDPYYVGGGIHQIQRGGKLAVHADFTEPPHLKLFRRLNLLVYLNPEWDDAYGGNFELWDEHAKSCKASVSPIGNRCVIFTTTSTSFHGHPHPLTCPEGMSRRSLAIYYYQLRKPAGGHGVVTRWHKEGEEAMGTVGRARNLAARMLWWVSYKFAGLAGRVDV